MAGQFNDYILPCFTQAGYSLVKTFRPRARRKDGAGQQWIGNLRSKLPQVKTESGGRTPPTEGTTDAVVTPTQGQRDPLGRDMGGTGTAGTPENMLQGEDVYRRAREILDELRRRSGEQQRPESERGYLRRLLDSF